MLVTSFFPGRIRLRAPIFKDEELCKKAMEIISKSDAVKNIQHNVTTGSILLEYDPKKVPMEKLVPMQDFFVKLGKKAEKYDGSEKIRAEIKEMLSDLENIVKSW